MKDVISIRDFTRSDLDSLIEQALELKREGLTNPPKGSNKKVASLFFEPSTRTRVSSETAAELDNDYVNGFAGIEGTSVKKGEPLADTVRMFEGYTYDAMVIRHSLEGAARFSAELIDIPLINGGDGPNGHPTQTMLDLMTIKERYGNIDGLKVAFIGDLKNGRTVHSLLHAFEHYNVEPWLISPSQVALPEWRVKEYEQRTGRKVVITPDLSQAIKECDVAYMTRIQRERFAEGHDGEIEYQKVSGIYRITGDSLTHANPNLIILHPLPRYKRNLEITMDVDRTPHAWYFRQAQNGMFMRWAILRRIFGEGFEGRPELGELPVSEEIPITNTGEKKENLFRFRNGTFIDHLEPGAGYQIKPLLGLMDYRETPVLIINNLPSTRHGLKDIYAIADRELSPEQLWKLSLISERATVNIIQNGVIVRKFRPLPTRELNNIVECQNPNCISRPEHYEHVDSRFTVESQEPLRIRCHYCERPMERGEIKLI
ncbi:MAG: aspartate carbamoyltransferase [Candidatus Woesearchaeota archaeon]